MNMRVILLLLLAVSIPLEGLAQLSEKNKSSLTQAVRAAYQLNGLEGAQVYKTGSYRVLVSIVEVSDNLGSTQQSRIAQMKATRAASEFLEGANNRAISVYDSDSFSDDQYRASTELGEDYSVAQSKSEGSSTASSEHFSDKIIQESRAKIQGMQPLLKFAVGSGKAMYAYYIVIDKRKANKKY